MIFQRIDIKRHETLLRFIRLYERQIIKSTNYFLEPVLILSEARRKKSTKLHVNGGFFSLWNTMREIFEFYAKKWLFTDILSRLSTEFAAA
jgi:hypothetical protein